MGEVYRARDTRLDRSVAIKVLAGALAADPQFRERFDREARVISSLSHAHICALFDVGHEQGVDFLVMEYLDGETLAERIAKGALKVSDALRIGIEIAGALDVAHRAGIIHRDLKPGNIMLTKAGAKLLDFGLAKVSAPVVAVAGSMLPTTPPSMTAQGTILGTFQYMAPEQIEGLDADARTDIFAFGAVLFEMLAGRPAFEGKTRASLLGAILKDEPPPVSQVQPLAPAALNRIVATCLAKEPDDRWQTARDLLRELRWIAEGTIAESGATNAASPGPIAGSKRPGLRRALPWAVAGVLGTFLAIVLVMWAPWRPPSPAASMRFSIVPPAPASLSRSGADRQIAMSPDGSHVVYVAATGGGQTQLMVRALDRLDAEPLRGITNARAPFISPDGKWVGFFQGTELRKVSITGGPPITLCRVTGAPRGASWGPNDTIIFATADSVSGLLSVPAGGGDPKVLTQVGQAQSELDHLFPAVLPAGRAVLFTIQGATGTDTSQVAVLDLETGQRKTLIRGGSHAEYVETGHLVYAAAGSLRAVRFDPVRLEVLGDAVPVLEDVAMGLTTGAANFSVSRSGSLVYMPGGPAGPAETRSLVWVNRQGREEPIQAPPRAYFVLRLSPDGTSAALDIRDEENDIWTWDFARQTLTRLTFDQGGDIFPIWTPDGRRIIFSSVRAGLQNVYSQAADGTGVVERLTTAPHGQFAMSVSPDGKSLVVTEQKASNDLSLLSIDGKGPPAVLVETMFGEGLAEISPDGQWLAYQSNESGQDQVYVRPFPNVNTGRWQISTSGGTKPVWARNGRELFYVDGAGALTTVPIVSTPAFSAGNPLKLFGTRYFSAVQARSYDVAPDGQRFLMIKDPPASSQNTTQALPSMVVVLNWFEELKTRVR